MKTLNDNSVKISRPISLIFIVLTILIRCSKSKDTTTPGANVVLIQSFAFSPSTITVSVNTTITWTNKDAAAHTVTSDTGLFDSGNLTTDATYTHQFTTAGTFPYHCTYHSNMLAKVIVQ
jgi:plastocyanin